MSDQPQTTKRASEDDPLLHRVGVVVAAVCVIAVLLAIGWAIYNG